MEFASAKCICSNIQLKDIVNRLPPFKNLYDLQIVSQQGNDNRKIKHDITYLQRFLRTNRLIFLRINRLFKFRLKIRFRDHVINVVLSLYSETLIIRPKAALCIVYLCGAQPRSSHKLASLNLAKNQAIKRQSQQIGACGLKKIVEIYNKINKDCLLIFLSSRYVKIVRFAIQRNQIN